MATNVTDKSRGIGGEAEDELIDLLRRVTVGEADAMSQLVSDVAFRSLLKKVCYCTYREFSAPRAEYGVEDLVQDVMLRLIKRPERNDKVFMDVRSLTVLLRREAEMLLSHRMRRKEGSGEALAAESGARRRRRASPGSPSGGGAPPQPEEVMVAAILELESLSASLDSDPDSIESMSVADVVEELRESGLDADKPLFESNPGRMTDSINRRTGDRRRLLWQISWAGEEHDASTIVEEEENEDLSGGSPVGGKCSPPTPEGESFIDALAEEIQNELADPLFQVLLSDAEFQRTLDAICKRLLPHATPEYTAEDLKQDVLVKFGRWLWRYRYEASFEKVLEKIARNQLIDMRRRPEDQAAPLDVLLPDEVGTELETRPRRPSRSGQAVLRVGEWLDALRENERRLFVRHLLEGRSLAEIGRELGITRQAMSKRWLRILDKLRPLLVEAE